MEYRKLPMDGRDIGVIGFGTSVIGGEPQAEAEATFAEAIEKGVNLIDLACGHAPTFKYLGNVAGSAREKLYYQIPFGADYTSGVYARSYKLDDVKRAIDGQLRDLKTDYIDFAFIHCVDEDKNLDLFIKEGVLDYMNELKAQGVVKAAGLSSHTPSLANRVMDMTRIDLLMFSINPCYDYRLGAYGIGSVKDRQDLYRRCQREGVGISVMKTFGGGQLLDDKTSPFKKALTRTQCIHYALDKPAVLAVMPGFHNRQELREALAYLDAAAEERDYSVIGTFTPQEADGICVYCNHCQPCPMGIDIATVNKYYDLTLAGDDMARDHYMNLSLHASDCVKCGHCNSTCPFRVDQMARMDEIAARFGL